MHHAFTQLSLCRFIEFTSEFPPKLYYRILMNSNAFITVTIRVACVYMYSEKEIHFSKKKS